MKIGIYSPYLNTLGGGEKYLFDLAMCFPEAKIDIFWNDKTILEKINNRFGFEIKNITIRNDMFSNSGFIKKFQITRNYDVFFYCSDGSMPLLFAKKNIVIFQFPMPWILHIDPITKIKLSRVDTFLCYSSFVKQHIDKTFSISSTVLYPAVDKMPEATRKENIILSVGRFTKGKNTKKQEVLIDTFKQYFSTTFRGFKLYLLGGVLDEDIGYIKELEDLAKGYPVFIKPNVSFATLQDAYSKAKIYWHAAGFDEDLVHHPEYAEHFGITTIEAMSAGCIPLSFDAGGQKEIIENGISGFLWRDLPSLVSHTKELILSNKLQRTLSENAKNRAVFFQRERFFKELQSIVK